jgi:lipid-binding SYLF domain-containing protein
MTWRRIDYGNRQKLDESVKGPDAGIPKDLLKRAACVAVIPAVKKGGFGFGGQAMAVVRPLPRTKRWIWSDVDAMIGGSFGLQIRPVRGRGDAVYDAGKAWRAFLG